MSKKEARSQQPVTLHGASRETELQKSKASAYELLVKGEEEKVRAPLGDSTGYRNPSFPSRSQ